MSTTMEQLRGSLAIVPPQAPTVTDDQLDLIKRTVAKGATADELKLYFYDCQRRNVHPLDKLIYFTKRKSGEEYRYTPITSIDFMRSQAADSGDYAGNDDAVFAGIVDGKFPEMATVTVWRVTQGHRCPYTASARWKSYYPGGGNDGFMWRKMPEVMLGKCAEALALRKAFPKQLAGLYSQEEMAQAPEQGFDREAYVEHKIAELQNPAPAGRTAHSPAVATTNGGRATNSAPVWLHGTDVEDSGEAMRFMLTTNTIPETSKYGAKAEYRRMWFGDHSSKAYIACYDSKLFKQLDTFMAGDVITVSYATNDKGSKKITGILHVEKNSPPPSTAITPDNPITDNDLGF